MGQPLEDLQCGASVKALPAALCFGESEWIPIKLIYCYSELKGVIMWLYLRRVKIYADEDKETETEGERPVLLMFGVNFLNL